MATRITPADRSTSVGQNSDMERSIAVSAETVGSVGLYSSVVTTAPGGRTRIHHHGECETSIFILAGRARYTWGPTGLDLSMEAGEGDFVYIRNAGAYTTAYASEFNGFPLPEVRVFESRR